MYLASTIMLVELLGSNRVNAFASGESGICRAKIQVDSIQTAVVSRSFVDVQNRYVGIFFFSPQKIMIKVDYTDRENPVLIACCHSSYWVSFTLHPKAYMLIRQDHKVAGSEAHSQLQVPSDQCKDTSMPPSYAKGGCVLHQT